MEDLSYFCFHSPFGKLVQKSFGRLLYNDLITCPDALQAQMPKEQFLQIEQFAQISHQDSLTDKALEKAFVKGIVQNLRTKNFSYIIYKSIWMIEILFYMNSYKFLNYLSDIKKNIWDLILSQGAGWTFILTCILIS